MAGKFSVWEVTSSASNVPILEHCPIAMLFSRDTYASTDSNRIWFKNLKIYIRLSNWTRKQKKSAAVKMEMKNNIRAYEYLQKPDE